MIHYFLKVPLNAQVEDSVYFLKNKVEEEVRNNILDVARGFYDEDRHVVAVSSHLHFILNKPAQALV